MPHFVIECSENVLKQHSPKTIMQKIHNTAVSSGLFDSWDIKVRINQYTHYTIGNTTEDFIHVFANIMEGRSTSQKRNLSRMAVKDLNELFPEVNVISINIRDFEKATYCNKSMI